jgi:large subunit ribosomal protein L15
MPVLDRIKHPSNLKRRKRKGRGLGSGLGKTSGRGQMGQKSRSGGTIHPAMEGARTPVIRQFPKLGGFKHHSKVYYHPVNLVSLAEAQDGDTIDLVWLEKHSLLPKKLRGLRVKLLGDGEITSKLAIKLHAFSHRAKAKVEAAGGSCELI